MVYKFFEKKSVGGAVESVIMSDQQLAYELHKPVIKNFKKHKKYSSFRDNIWGADLPGLCYYYVLLIFLVNIHGFFFSKIKKALQLLLYFKRF